MFFNHILVRYIELIDALVHILFHYFGSFIRIFLEKTVFVFKQSLTILKSLSSTCMALGNSDRENRLVLPLGMRYIFHFYKNEFY